MVRAALAPTGRGRFAMSPVLTVCAMCEVGLSTNSAERRPAHNWVRPDNYEQRRHHKQRRCPRLCERLESGHMLNAAPDANDDFFTLSEDSVLVGNLLVNDVDLD